ncbi:MAG: hypothetical protein COT85_07850 [Chlamydiae bacterium CG10_big_fil_rev_8_21_14_0_10_42_34]|nr:MAG: hypothetical protein COT85_07850 [Chlamydiae bacterium CG10_big_fil_rev_8_21_14_0_10_42_34]
MNEQDNKTRKTWITLLIITTIANISYSTINFFTAPVHTALQNATPQYSLFVISISIVGALLTGYIMYRCAYKKPGTKLLTFMIYSTPITYAATILMWMLGKLPELTPTYSLYLAASTALTVWWYTLHLKMRAINRQLKAS